MSKHSEIYPQRPTPNKIKYTNSVNLSILFENKTKSQKTRNNNKHFAESRDMEITHQRSLKDLRSQMSMEKSSFEQRDLQSAQEIETLHKKCRCLTKL